MRIGVPREIKVHEYRVGLTPPAVAELTARGHKVIVEKGAGAGIDFADSDYIAAGAEIVATPEAVFAGADMIVKVHLSAPGRRQAAGRGADGIGRHLHRL